MTKKKDLVNLLDTWPDIKRKNGVPSQFHTAVAYKNMFEIEKSRKQRTSVLEWLIGKYTSKKREEMIAQVNELRHIRQAE